MENRMKNLSGRAVIALLAIMYGAAAFAQDRPQVINIPLSRPGEPVRLSIDIITARIEVIGEDRDDVSFEVLVAGGKRKIITPSGAQAINSGSYSFDIDEDDNEISFDTDHRAEKVSLVARIPKRANLELSTVNDGAIIVSNITGNLELSNTNGPITATKISGSIIAESINAAISASFSKIDEVNASSFETINGDITVGIPAAAGAELHLDSARGEITSDFEVAIVPTDGTVTREDGRDGVEVRVEQNVVARIGDGGPVLRFKTLHGDIHIRQAQ